MASFVTDFEDALLIALGNHFTIPIILDYQGGSEPEGDYGVIGITTMNKLHRDTKNYFTDTSDGVYKERLKQDFEIVMTFRFYGNSCYDNAFEAQAFLSQRDTQETLYTNNDISIIDVTSIRRIPELRDTGYIQRAMFDINMLIGFVSLSESDYFNTVEYTGEYQDQDGSTILTTNTTVTNP